MLKPPTPFCTYHELQIDVTAEFSRKDETFSLGQSPHFPLAVLCRHMQDMRTGFLQPSLPLHLSKTRRDHLKPSAHPRVLAIPFQMNYFVDVELLC